jgi:hypothetical protein
MTLRSANEYRSSAINETLNQREHCVNRAGWTRFRPSSKARAIGEKMGLLKSQERVCPPIPGRKSFISFNCHVT